MQASNIKYIIIRVQMIRLEKSQHTVNATIRYSWNVLLTTLTFWHLCIVDVLNMPLRPKASPVSSARDRPWWRSWIEKFCGLLRICSTQIVLTSGSNGLSGSCDIPHTANIDKYMKPRDMMAGKRTALLQHVCCHQQSWRLDMQLMCFRRFPHCQEGLPSLG